MKTLLLNLPKNLHDRNDYDQVAQPLGLAYLSSYLKQHGREAVLYDAHARHLTLPEVLRTVEDIAPRVIGLTAMTFQLPVIVDFLRELKARRPDIVTVLGGPHVAPEHVSTLETYPEVDYAVRGEGELTLVELLGALEGGRPLDQVQGLTWRQGGAVQVNPARPFIEDLDSLPYPDYASLPMDRYWDVFTTRKNYVRIMASRGCPYNCTFCGAHIAMGRKPRMRSPQNIVGELAMLQRDHGVREFLFNDSTFNIDNAWVRAICEELMRLPRRLVWRCNVRADRLDRETIRIMKRSGCVKVVMGIESADQDMLDRMRKGESLDDIKQALAVLKEEGMPSDHGFILGMPGETAESARRTIEFARAIDSSVVSFSLATPFPGTEFYEQARKEGLTVDDWSRFDFFGLPYTPQGMDGDELRRFYREAVNSFYLRPSYLVKRLLEMRSWTNLKINLWFLYRILRRRFLLADKGKPSA